MAPPVCDQRLVGARHVAWLPLLRSRRDPIAMKSSVCGLKASCCDVASFNVALGAFQQYDRLHDSRRAGFERFRQYPHEVLEAISRTAAQGAFSFQTDLALLDSLVRDHIERVVASIDNQNVFVRLDAVHNAILGYATALLCSMCDPFQKLYVNPALGAGDGAEGEQASDEQQLHLNIRAPICTEIADRVKDFMELAAAQVVSLRNAQDVNATFDSLCRYAGPPMDPNSKFPRQGRDGCNEAKLDFAHLRNLLLHMEHSQAIGLLGCNSTETCAELFCEGTMQGLGVSFALMRSGAIEALDRLCTNETGCDPARLRPYVEYLLPSDATLAKWVEFTNGPRVVNTLVQFDNETALDAKRFGCGMFLSRHACTVLPDVTFTSTHIKAIVITCSIIGGLLSIGLYLLYRNFALSCTKRRRPAAIKED